MPSPGTGLVRGGERAAGYSVEGFTGRASARPGQPVALYAHSLEGPVVVKAYRMGRYPVPERGWCGPRRPLPTSTNRSPSSWGRTAPVGVELDTVRDPSHRRLAARRLPPEAHATSGTANLIPLTVRSRRPRRGRDVNENTTWQAYNGGAGPALPRADRVCGPRTRCRWTARSLLLGTATTGATRPGRPAGREAGTRVAYVTKTDLHADPQLLAGARA